VAGVMIDGKQKRILYRDEAELRRSLRLLKAFNTPGDAFHREAREEIGLMGSPLIEVSAN